MIAMVPFEQSGMVVVLCGLAAAALAYGWLRTRSAACLGAGFLAVAIGGGACIADRLVVTDREYLQAWLPELAAAFERRDLETIMAAVDPELQPLRDEARRLLEQVAPSEVEITSLDIDLTAGSGQPAATADMIVRVTGSMLGPGGTGTAIVKAVASLEKRGNRWLVTDCVAEPVRSLGGRQGGARR